MTQEEKDLLLKDLCSRQLHGVIIDSAEYNEAAYHKHYLQRLISIKTLANKLVCIDVDDYPDPKIHDWKIELCKPYLRPMSSMTEEEKKKLKADTCPKGTGYFDEKYLICPINHYGEHISYEFMSAILEWLNAHHFDYRGLIEKGLALEAPEGMYDTGIN